MKKISLLLMAIALFSCNKNAKNTQPKVDSMKIIDSINQARNKYNDSIRTLNNKNRFGDLSGVHKLTFHSDKANFSGTINFKKSGRDQYEVIGNANSNSNSLKIEGTVKRVSDKHLNFEGKISEKIGGKPFVRSHKTTFTNEGKGEFWRLQDKLNGDGFIEYIDIYYP